MTPSDNRHIYEFGPFRLVPSEKHLLREGEVVGLTPKSFDLLVVLVENAGRLVEKSQLMTRVWPDSFVEEANLSVKMSELRRALGESSNENQYIETVPRRGYRFVAPVKEVPPLSEDGPSEGSEVVDVQGDNRRSEVRRFWLIGVAGVLVVAVLLFVFDVGGLRQRLVGAPDPVSIRSLAVLPLENLSGDPSQDYFAEGMTEALITDLAKIRELRVISRASVMRYKAADIPLSQIASELNVDALLTGSVIRSGDRVRISVLLVHVPTDQNLWAESYERDLRDVIALQGEVTRDVVGRIRLKLGAQGQTSATSYPTVNPEAYDHYLRGKFHLHRQTRADNDAAITALERSVAIDPGFAVAHAELAQAYVWKLFLFDPSAQRQWAEKAFLASEKAIAMNPDLAVAYLARGRLLWTPANHFPHDRAIREYQKAIALDPNLDEARNQLALVYNHVGAFDEAMQELQTAVATNPGNSLARFRIGETLLFAGKYDEALTALRGVPNDTNPALVGHQIVWALFNLGRKDEAVATLRQFLAEHPEENSSLLESIQAVMAAAGDRRDEAEKHIERATGGGKGFGHFHHTAYHIACAYARMNRKAEAMKWLESTAKEGFPCYPMFERDPNLANLRGEPEFTALIAKLKQQWEDIGRR